MNLLRGAAYETLFGTFDFQLETIVTRGNVGGQDWQSGNILPLVGGVRLLLADELEHTIYDDNPNIPFWDL